MEHYTSVLGSCTKEELEAFYGREVILADRDLVESFDHEGSNEDEILKGASTDDVAVLVVGKRKLSNRYIFEFILAHETQSSN